MIFSDNIKEALERKLGQEIRLSSDAECLALDIESKTRQSISVNTMKRLLGFIKDERMPRISTLDIVAQYLGYDCWDTLAHIDNKIYSSSFSSSVRELRIDKLADGTRVRFEYKPDRVLIIRYMGNHHFVVEHSENSKLLIGDELELWHMMRRYPLYVDNVVRNGEDLGSFTAGKASGITAFKVLKEGKEA